jgi:hypothetical protein
MLAEKFCTPSSYYLGASPLEVSQRGGAGPILSPVPLRVLHLHAGMSVRPFVPPQFSLVGRLSAKGACPPLPPSSAPANTSPPWAWRRPGAASRAPLRQPCCQRVSNCQGLSVFAARRPFPPAVVALAACARSSRGRRSFESAGGKPGNPKIKLQVPSPALCQGSSLSGDNARGEADSTRGQC